MAADAALVTGYPNFVVTRLVARLVEDCMPVYVLCKEDFEGRAKRDFRRFGTQVKVVTGDVVCMDLGLSGEEVKEVREQVSRLFHLAGIYYLGSSEDEMALVNIEGTRNNLSFAAEMPILEEELIEPARFRNPFERTKFTAERIVREACSQLPITIVRPSLIVGDSTSGEIDKLDGPHFFMQVLVNLPVSMHLPLIGKGDYPLNLVPVDYVVQAMAHIGRHPDAVGRTFHLVDLNTFPSRRVFEILCEVADKKPPRRSIPTNLATYLMKMPGLEKAWRSPRLFMEMLNQLVLYNAMNTTELLRGTDISCPAFPSYAKNLVEFLRKESGRKKKG